ncbi:MAG TPA: Hsp70 family protein [Thermohalobaculum sp.]|nr:Hsp70 family protein [Thermohalobaculum sp.]
MHADTLAIDFGTSNSAAAILSGTGVHRIPIEGGADTLPTAVFFPSGGGEMLIGAAATQALIDGEDGRYMRALKSVLGLPLTHETRLISGRSRTIGGIITDFLTALRERSEAATGQRYRKALSGRPVHFHTADKNKDRQAEDDLRACYLGAGFDEVSFLAEPEAAALACHGLGGRTEVGLIVDIGGGTSDFSVFRSRGVKPAILGSHGIRLGGTDFDHAISIAHAMPPLGIGGQLRSAMGAALLPVPRRPYVDLATWSQIPFLYTAETRRMVAQMIRFAVEPEKVSRYGTVIEHELGHELAFAVERTKISVNASGRADAIGMGFIEAGLSQTVSPENLAATLASNRILLREAAMKTLQIADIDPNEVERVILVGGSSLMTFVSDEMSELCSSAEILRSEAFTAVIDGLAMATSR